MLECNTSFVQHLRREEHFNNDCHQAVLVKLEKEIHVARLIKQVRVLKGIVKQGMHPTHW